jgi:hypothetical protein
MLAPPNCSMELTSGLAVAQPDSAALRPTAARRSRRFLRPWGVQLISRPLGGVDGLWTMRSMKENEREVPNGTEAL